MGTKAEKLLDTFRVWATLTSGRQRAYYKQMLKDAKPVEISSVYDVFTAEELEKIRTVIKPEPKHCYKNALLLCLLDRERIRYVEGYGLACGVLPAEHAFNVVDGKYVDITWELACEGAVVGNEYIALIEASEEEVFRDVELHDNMTGNYYQHQWELGKKRVGNHR